MNKLRELIASDEAGATRWAWEDVQIYLVNNRYEICDLIDEAQKIGLTLREDHPLAIALSKLEK